MNIRGLFSTKQNPVNAKYLALSQGLGKLAENHQQQADFFCLFAQSLSSFLAANVPAAQGYSESMGSIYRKLSSLNIELAKAEERSSDDINDIYERLKVCDRMNAELTAVADAYKEADHDLINVFAEKLYAEKSPDYESKSAGFEAKIEAAREVKRQKLALYKEALQTNIDFKKQFIVFKVNRLTHALSVYKNAWELYRTKSNELYNDFLAITNKINIDVLAGLMQPLEDGLARHIEQETMRAHKQLNSLQNEQNLNLEEHSSSENETKEEKTQKEEEEKSEGIPEDERPVFVDYEERHKDEPIYEEIQEEKPRMEEEEKEEKPRMEEEEKPIMEEE